MEHSRESIFYSPLQMSKEQFETMLEEAGVQSEAAIAKMVDGYPCGGAYLTTDGHSFITKLFKKYGFKEGNQYKIVLNSGARWSMSKGYPKGFTLSCYVKDGRGYQNMDMDSTKYNTIVKTFAGYNIPVSVRTYID